MELDQGKLMAVDPVILQSARKHGIHDHDMFHAYRTQQVSEVTFMPRSIQEILDQADELAQRFENYEPDEADERPVEEYMLERAALARARGERQVADAVIAARASGASWQKIGSLLGTSAQAAQQRYGALIDAS